MGDLPRWASRFQFTRELWIDADRIVLDPALERALASGELAAGEGPIFAELADALLPHESGESRTWFLAERGRRVAEYARQRGGTVFSDIRDGVQIVAEEGWSLAQCDLTGLLEEDVSEVGTSLQERVGPRVAALLETLAERAEEGGRVILSVPSRQAMGKRGVTEEVFFDYLSEHFPGARVYGLADAPSIGIFDFGPVDEEEDDDEHETTHVVRPRSEFDYRSEEAKYDDELDEAERSWSGDQTEPELPRADKGDDEVVPIDYDNSLGEAEPRYFAYLALIGIRKPPQGLTVVELCHREGAQVDERGRELKAEGRAETGVEASGLRAQLAEAQRQADLLALERQTLLERLDESEERIESLEDAADDPDAPHGERVTTIVGEIELEGPLPAEALVGRLDAALAREQELRWRVQSLTAQLESTASRPVEALESEAARLRVRLEGLEGELGDAKLAAMVPLSPAVPAVALPATVPYARGDKNLAEISRLRAVVDHLLRKVERGGLNGMELHRALRSIRAQLKRC